MTAGTGKLLARYIPDRKAAITQLLILVAIAGYVVSNATWPFGALHWCFIMCSLGMTMMLLVQLLPQFYSLRIFEAGLSFPNLFGSRLIGWEDVVGFEISAEDRGQVKFHPQSDFIADPDNRVVTSLELPAIAGTSAKELVNELNQWHAKQIDSD